MKMPPSQRNMATKMKCFNISKAHLFELWSIQPGTRISHGQASNRARTGNKIKDYVNDLKVSRYTKNTLRNNCNEECPRLLILLKAAKE